MSERHRYRDRSPSSRYPDRSSERYRDRSAEKYRSSRYRDRSRSPSRERTRRTERHRRRSGSYSRSNRRRSTSRHRYRDSRSPPPRHQQHTSSSSTSSRYHSSKTSKSYRRSRSTSKSPSRDRDGQQKVSKNCSVSPSITVPQDYQIPKSQLSPSKYTYDDSTSDTAYDNHSIASNSKQITETHSRFAMPTNSLENYDDSFDEPIDKERIHREIEEKLRLALAKEGKVYPPPKPEPSHPVFANDGSFLEIFKQMQEQMSQQAASSAAEQKARTQPLWAKRRGGKILKTGIVEKSRTSDSNASDPKDFWSIYLQEVKKYKSSSCDVDSKTRPLVK